MRLNSLVIAFLLPIIPGCTSKAQSELSVSNSKGVKVIVINKNFPLLKVLLPNQPATDRGIEIEFPEHVTGLNEKNNQSEHLYLVSNGNANKRTLPVWHIDGKGA